MCLMVVPFQEQEWLPKLQPSMSNQVTSHCFVYYVRSIAAVVVVFQFSYRKKKVQFLCLKLFFLAWAWLAKAKGHCCHAKNQPLPKYVRKKRVKVRSTTGHYATKKRPVKITMYLGLDIIIKLKFTTIFDRGAILNVLNYLTKNFES